MKTIKFKSVTLSHFKGIKSLHVNFDDDITVIKGANGTGKTTLADSILWCLFGKNAEGDTKFSVRTLSMNGEPILNVEHSVTLRISVDGKEVTLKRELIYSETKRRGRLTGEIRKHTEFTIDGENASEKSYKAYISDIISESTFRALTSPTHFLSMKWQDQRTFLEQMVGSIDLSELNATELYKPVLPSTTGKSIDEYIKHLAYEIKQTNERLERIPDRIEEQERTCPEKQDWQSIRKERDRLSADISELQQRIVQLSTSSESIVASSLRSKIEFHRKRIDTMTKSAQRMADIEFAEYSNKKQKAYLALDEARTAITQMQGKLTSNQKLIDQAKATTAELQAEALQLRAEWKAKVNAPFVIPDNALICPTCGRAFDEDKREEVIARLREQYSQAKELARQTLTKRADRIKQDLADSESTIAAAEAALTETTNLISKTQKTVTELTAAYDEIKNGAPLDAQTRLMQNPSYKQCLDEIVTLEQQLSEASNTDASPLLAQTKETLADLQAEQQQLNSQLAQEQSYNTHHERIAELQTEQHNLRKQLDELCARQDLATEYSQRCDQLLEDEINRHFLYVRFTLFRSLNDGTRLPSCEAHIDGVPYSDLNTAGQINAGRDIINTLMRLYETAAPIICDNAERICEFLPLNTQEIRLYVTPDVPSLTINK